MVWVQLHCALCLHVELGHSRKWGLCARSLCTPGGSVNTEETQDDHPVISAIDGLAEEVIQ